jgi:spore germination cell wall hydrolase CwlJ-like protein
VTIDYVDIKNYHPEDASADTISKHPNDFSRSEFRGFLREVEVLIGPLSEKEGGGDSKKALRLFGDGTTDNFRIKFQLSYPVASSSVSIYNLSVETRNALQVPGLKIVVNAGWANVDRICIFEGALLNVISERQGADIVTNLLFMSGFLSTGLAFCSGTYASGKTVSAAVYEIASQTQHVTVDKRNINLFPKPFGSGGYTYSGTIAEELTKLARTYGFTWWIDKGIFYAMDDAKAFGGYSGKKAAEDFKGSVTMPLISGKTGTLLRAEPILIPPTLSTQSGVSVYSIFNPYVRYFDFYQLESTINEKLNGIWQVHYLQHYGDTHSDQWATEIRSTISPNNTVSSPAVVTSTDWTDVELLAGTIFGEASNQSDKGKIAVGITVRERVKHPNVNDWGSGWRDIMLKKGQFTCWQDHNKDRIVYAKENPDSVWNTCLSYAQKIYTGQNYNVGLSGIPTNYFATWSTPPSWSKSFPYLGTIGTHKFYRNPGAGA